MKQASNDEYLVLPVLQNTPITRLNESPAQLSIGRKLHSSFQMVHSTLEPLNAATVKEKLHS